MPARHVRLHVQAAVDAPNLSGDVSGGVGSQEMDDSGYLLRLSEAPERNLRPEPVQHLLRHAVEHLRRGVARRDRVYGQPDPVSLTGALQLHGGPPGKGLGEPEQPRLGGGVVTWPMPPVSPMTEEIITMRPLPRSSMCSRAAWER